MGSIGVLGVAFVYLLMFLVLGGLAERYIPDRVWEKFDQVLICSEEVVRDE